MTTADTQEISDEITLDADKKAAVLRKIHEMWHAITTMHDAVKSRGCIGTSLARNLLKCSGYYLSDLGKVLGVETETSREIEERHAAIRAANARVHELEAMIGGQQSPQAIQMGIKSMSAQLNKWWDLEGFGHIPNIRFGQWACEVKFSCMLHGDFHLINSTTPVSDKERRRLWLESLTARGFILLDDGGDDYILDCDQSRKTLIELFSARLPSAKVFSFENHSRKGHQFALRDVTVMVHDIAEITTLPVPDAKQGATA
jgi:hypothetical protein